MNNPTVFRAARNLGFAALGLLCAVSTPALADEAEAEACVRQKVWDGYNGGWAIRTLTATTLKSGATQNYLVTFYKGNEYQVQTCSDDGTRNVDILLYDLAGNIVVRDDSVSGVPSITYKPTETATYYVVAYARELAPDAEKAAIAVAVTYR